MRTLCGHLKTISYAAVAAFFVSFAANVLANDEAATTTRPAAQVEKICPGSVTYTCIAANFDTFVNIARNGDARAVDLLYKSLAGCQSVSALADPSTPTTVTDLGTGESHLSYNDDHLERVVKPVRMRCANFSATQISTLDEIAWLAAAQGNGQALFNLTSKVSHSANPVQKASEINRLFAILQDNINHKRFESLAVFSTIYYEGLLTERDYVKAYAYSLAYLSTLPEAERSRHALRAQMIAPRLSAAEKATADSTSRLLINN